MKKLFKDWLYNYGELRWMWVHLAVIFLLLAMFTSCGALDYVGNPAPNMKTVHMATEHDGYTQEDVNQHPDYDCDQDPSRYVLISDR